MINTILSSRIQAQKLGLTDENNVSWLYELGLYSSIVQAFQSQPGANEVLEETLKEMENMVEEKVRTSPYLESPPSLSLVHSAFVSPGRFLGQDGSIRRGKCIRDDSIHRGKRRLKSSGSRLMLEASSFPAAQTE